MIEIENKFEESIEKFRSIGIEILPDLNFSSLFESEFWIETLERYIRWNHSLRYLFLYRLSHTMRFWENDIYIYKPISNQLWLFDAERDDHVKYGNFIVRLNEMSHNKFLFENVENVLDPPYGVRFDYSGKFHYWTFRANRDWADMSFFDKFTNTIKAETEGKHDKKYFIIQEDQGGIILYLTEDEIRELYDFLPIKNYTPKLL